MKKVLLNTLAWITGASKQLLAFILPILAASTATVLEQLLPQALQIVASLATSDGTGEEKRKAAAAQLQTAAINAGVAASASVINLAVEMAVQKLKEVQ